MELTPVSREAATGAMLRRARERQGISCRTLATRLGWDHSELSRIERGRVTPLSRYEQIARALGLEMAIRFRRAA